MQGLLYKMSLYYVNKILSIESKSGNCVITIKPCQNKKGRKLEMACVTILVITGATEACG